MKFASIILSILLLSGCSGYNSTFPCCSGDEKNPLNRQTERAWWQADTAAVTTNSPWNKFVKTEKSVDESPKLFPDGWKPRADKEKQLDTLKPKKVSEVY